MIPGALQHEIILQAPDAGQDSVGQPVTTWTTFATVRAHIRDANGRQFAAAQAMQNAVYAEITIRYLPGVTPAMRVLHGTDVYDIESILGQDRFWLTLMCSRGKGTDSGLVGGSGLVEKVVPVDADSFGLSDSESAGILRKFTWASLKAALVGIFAPSAKGVTNGDSHDHNGGDGAQIAYSSISGLPTLGNSAPLNVGTSAGTVAAGNDSRIVAATPAETTTTIGALINGATSDSSPVDADQIGIMDSTAANILKKLSWAALKTSLASIFATLAGKSGGQTLQGGTASGETLTLQSTAHATKGKVNFGALSAYDEVNARLGIGTTAPAAKMHAIATTEQVRIGYDAATYMSATVGSTGECTLAATGATIMLQGIVATDTATLGAELLGSAGWTVPGGWAESPDDVFTHSSGGGTNALSHSASISSATKYQIAWTISGRTTGSINMSVGGVASGAQTATGTFGPTTVSTAGLTVTPTTDFDGAVTISLKAISAVLKPIFSAKTSSGSVGLEARFVGLNVLGFGLNAARYCTTGFNLVAIGSSALQSDTTGYSNTAIGNSSLPALTTGYFDVGVGVAAGFSITTGSQNTFIGTTAGYNIVSSSGVLAAGAQAGRYQSDGTTALSACGNSIYLGYNAKGFNDSDLYSIVIGANAAGLGANTSVIGTVNQTTAATIYGAGTHSLTDATTNAAVTVETLTKNVTGAGVGATGLGPRLVFAAESSTTVDTTQADITATWTDATHATRKTRLALSATDSAAAREGIRIEADGSVARIGFFGVTAVIKPTALTATVAAAPAGGTGTAAGGWDTAGNRDLAIATINNVKTRVDQLESKLQALGLLT